MKVRLQSQPSHLPLRYTGPLDCFRQSILADGIIGGLYRGVSAPLFGAALEISSLFFWERVAQKSFYFTNLYPSDAPLPLSALFMTGAISGAATSLILTPIELVKCKMQVPITSAGVEGSAVKAAGITDVVKSVWRHQGIGGFWNGQMGTLIRETGGCAAWFGSKETVTALFHHLNNKKALASASPTATALDHASPLAVPAPLPLWQQAMAGAAAGMSYNFLFYPADTIKSRMQTSAVERAVGEPAMKQSFVKEGMALWKQAGLKGMYRGCGITVARSAPSSAVIFMLYDGLKKQFPFA